MIKGWPKITAHRTMSVSPWMSIIEREVEFAPDVSRQLYHSVGQRDYIAIVAALPDGRIPIVRQYRPALESFTWELPAGIVDQAEEPATCCRRELLEETGFLARDVHALGTYAPCTSRLSNWVHSFYVETGLAPVNNTIEAVLELILATPLQLARLIATGKFVLQLHIGALLLAGMQGYIDLAAFKTSTKTE
jgi:ADP-ribose pyrophosphatase